MTCCYITFVNLTIESESRGRGRESFLGERTFVPAFDSSSGEVSVRINIRT